MSRSTITQVLSVAQAVHGPVSICGTHPLMWGGVCMEELSLRKCCSLPQAQLLPLRHPSAHLLHHPAPCLSSSFPLKLLPCLIVGLGHLSSELRLQCCQGCEFPSPSPWLSLRPVHSIPHTYHRLNADSLSIGLFFWGTRGSVGCSRGFDLTG